MDFLFVVDNSGSMARAQRTLSRSLPRFVALLRRAQLDYRIAFVSTDMNPTECRNHTAPTMGPKMGDMQAISCLDREPEFQTQGGDLSRFNTACKQFCSQSGLKTLPSAVEADGSTSVISRPWVEERAGTSNLPNEVSVEEALMCFGALGIRGCGMEAQLESMHRALEKSQEPTAPNFGFLRPHANLSVVFITDEVDCSVNPWTYSDAFKRGSPFLPEMYSLNYSCLRAGTQCSPAQPVGSTQPYAQCVPADFAADGTKIEDPTQAANKAILHPISRYIEALDALRAIKQGSTGGGEVFVSLIGGVPASGGANISYFAAADDEAEREYGIGKGCTATSGVLDEINPKTGETVPGADSEIFALPPVRLREVVRRFAPKSETNGIYSLCSESMDYPFDDLVDTLGTPTTTGCFPGCVADDNAVPGDLLRPICEVASREGGVTTQTVVECLRENGVYLMNGQDYVAPCLDGSNLCDPAQRVDRCYAMLTDATNLTSATSDNLAQGCRDKRSNLQFSVQYTNGVPEGTDSFVEVSCVPSATPDTQCPAI